MIWLDAVIQKIEDVGSKMLEPTRQLVMILTIAAFFVVSFLRLVDGVLLSSQFDASYIPYFIIRLVFLILFLITLMVGVSKQAKLLALLALAYVLSNALPTWYQSVITIRQASFLDVLGNTAEAFVFLVLVVFIVYYIKKEPVRKLTGSVLILNAMFVGYLISFLYFGFFSETALFMVLAILGYRYYNSHFGLLIGAYALLNTYVSGIVFRLTVLSQLGIRNWATWDQWIVMGASIGLGIYFLVMVFKQNGLAEITSSLKASTETLDETLIHRNK